MAAISFSKTFSGAVNSLASIIESALPIVCGIPESALNSVSDRYVVTITSIFDPSYQQKKQVKSVPRKMTWTIYAYLQESFVVRVSSQWDEIAHMFDNVPGVRELRNVTDLGFQAAGRTSITTVSTRRKWSGSSPVEIEMKLKFEAMNDVRNEVILPCVGLQGLVLPRGGLYNAFGLVPPGPSPFKIGDSLFTGEAVSIDVGGFIKFKSIIVKDVSVKFDNRMSKDGPIGAEATIILQTYEMLTKEGLQDAYSIPSTPTGTMGNAIKSVPSSSVT